jgi:hypothetical protein
MPDFSKYRSRFIKSEEVKQTGPQTRRITGGSEVELKDPKTGDATPKFCLHLDDRLFPLNATNMDYLFKRFGSYNTDTMLEELVTVYFDEDIAFGSQKRGGLRLRDPDVTAF